MLDPLISLGDKVTTPIEIAAVIQVVLVALRLFGVIRWSWWLVLTPAWLSLLAILALVVMAWRWWR